MFNNLIESKRKRERSVGGTLSSILAHAGLIALAVWITAQAGTAVAKEKVQEDVNFVEVKKEPPPPEPEKPPPPPPDVVVKPPPPKGFQTLQAPINIPDKIPEVDLTKAVTNEADFSGKGVEGGVAKGVEGGKGPVDQDQPYFEFQVEKPVLAREGNPAPRYPSMLESARVEGEVLVQFVVDTAGRAEMSSFKVLKSSNDLFTSAVKRVLPEMKFYAAEVGGHKVRQLVQMPFGFKVPR